MGNDLIDNICDWNNDRDNYNFIPELEAKMLEEELTEFKTYDSKANAAKELADLIFVAVGSLFKLTGGDNQKVKDILLAVTAANDMKPKRKVDGKVVKGHTYINPEAFIKGILNEG